MIVLFLYFIRIVNSNPPANCLTVNQADNTQCQACNVGYTLQNNICFLNINNCTSYAQDATTQVQTCTACITGNYLFQSKCFIANITNCQTYTQIQNSNLDFITSCTKCANYYYLASATSCLSIPLTNCQQYSNLKCTLCDDNYELQDAGNCVLKLANCQKTLQNIATQYTYCQNCIQGYVGSLSDFCYGNILNCALYDASLTNCLKCSQGYQLSSDSKICIECSIKFCQNCGTSKVFGQQCLQCNQGFVQGQNLQSCITQCERDKNMTFCTSCSSGCTQCVNGYYLNSQYQCQSCTQVFSNCDTCVPTSCQSCSLGYFLLNTQCSSCNLFMQGCNVCLNQNKCQQCAQGYVLRNNICAKCSDEFQFCASCKFISGTITCQTCNPGYQYYTENNLSYCVTCLQLVNIQNCLSCDIASQACTKCQQSYYLSTSFNCLPCQNSCLICDSNNKCSQCVTNYILVNNICTQSLQGFQLLSNETTYQALQYSNIALQQYTLNVTYKKINASIPTLKKGYFCSSDKQCNMNGRCLTIMCQCISGITGSRCQFTNTTDMSNYHTVLLSYLAFQQPLDTFMIEILINIADSSFAISEQNLGRAITLLTNYTATLFDERFYTIIGLLLKNSVQIQLMSTQKIVSLNNLLLQTVTTQASTLLVSQCINLTGLIQKQFLCKYDFTSSLSQQAFTSTFVRQNTSDICNNDQKALYPFMYFSNTSLSTLAQLQPNASSPLLINQMNLYFSPHRTTGQQQINSTVTRLQLISNGILINNSVDTVAVVPKEDQTYSDVNEKNVCVYWNDNKQIWDVLSNAQTTCQYYTICRITQFYDYATYINVTSNTTIDVNIYNIFFETDFEISLALKNGAFALSMSLVGLFMIWATSLTIYHKKFKRIQKRSNLYEIGIAQQSAHLESQPETDRAINRTLNINLGKKVTSTLIAVDCLSTSQHFQYRQLRVCTTKSVTFYPTTISLHNHNQDFSFGRLTAYFLITIIISWFTNYIFGGLAISFRRKTKKEVFGCYWLMYFIIFFGLLTIGIWQMYGLNIDRDLYLLVGFFIEFILDAIFCDLFITYLYQSLFYGKVFGFWKVIKFRGYYE
ncbi:hypothetical protein pb186bvf_016571 [Paramecium bursaria]